MLVLESPGAILTTIGPLTLRWYGLCIATGFILALMTAKAILDLRFRMYPGLFRDDIKSRITNLFEKLQVVNVMAKTRQFSSWFFNTKYEEGKEKPTYFAISYEEISNFAVAAIFSGIIGARLWFVFLNLDYFTSNPDEIFQIWLGGQSIQGGIVGASIGTLIYEIYLQNGDKFSWAKYLDKLGIAACITPIAQAIGRWGNFFNEEAFGRVIEAGSNVPIVVKISSTAQLHHPTFLYEMIWNLIVYFVMINQCGKLNGHKLVGLYLILYSFGRFIIEPMRTDSLMLGPFAAASVLAVLGVVIGFVIYKAPLLQK